MLLRYLEQLSRKRKYSTQERGLALGRELGRWATGIQVSTWRHRILTSKDQGPCQGQDSSPQEGTTAEQRKHLALGVLRCGGVFSRLSSDPGTHAIIWLLEVGDKMEIGDAEKARS